MRFPTGTSNSFRHILKKPRINLSGQEKAGLEYIPVNTMSDLLFFIWYDINI